MPDIDLSILPRTQRKVWDTMQKPAFTSMLKSYDLYLAGGTALALQLGHRQSHDFDFFTQKKGVSVHILSTVSLSFENAITRDQDRHTLHIEAQGVKLSFIGNYQYKRVEVLTLEFPLS